VPVIASARTWEALPRGTGAVRLFRLFFILISFTESHSTKIQENKLNFFFSQRKKTFQIWALYLEAAPLAEFHFKFEK
jgi:hypothetical protein